MEFDVVRALFQQAECCEPDTLEYVSKFRIFCQTLSGLATIVQIEDPSETQSPDGREKKEKKLLRTTSEKLTDELRPYIVKLVAVLRDYKEGREKEITEQTLITLACICDFDCVWKLFIDESGVSALSKPLTTKDIGVLHCLFRFVGGLCIVSVEFQKRLIDSGLLSKFLERFREFIKTPRSTGIHEIEKSEVVASTSSDTTNKNESFQEKLIELGVVPLLVNYVLENCQRRDDLLVVGCVTFLGFLSDGDKGNAVTKSGLIEDTLQIFAKSDNELLFGELVSLFESISKINEKFSLECVRRHWFEKILEYLTPLAGNAELKPFQQSLLDVLVLVTMPLSCSRELSESKPLQDLLFSWLSSSNESFECVASIIIANFCFDDKSAIKLVTERRFHVIVVRLLSQSIVNGNTKNVASYLSILKNILVPVSNRGLVHSDTNLADLVNPLLTTQDPFVLQKSFVVLRLMVLSEDNGFAIKAAQNGGLISRVSELLTSSDKFSIIKGSLIGFMVQLVIRVKDHFRDLSFINDHFIQGMASNAVPPFMAQFFVTSTSSRDFFVALTDEQVVRLLHLNYFKRLSEMSSMFKQKPVLVANLFHSFRRVADTKLSAEDSKGLNPGSLNIGPVFDSVSPESTSITRESFNRLIKDLGDKALGH